jgi:hypothetical protein
MVPRIIAVLTRFKPDWAVQLQPDALQAACQEAGYTTWRDRLLTPITTIQLFLWRILHGHTACSHLPHLSGIRCSASAYCQARTKLPRPLFRLLLTRLCTSVQPHVSDDGGGTGIVPCSSMGLSAPGPIPLCNRRRSASRWSRTLVVVFPSPDWWGSSMPVQGS